MQAIGDFRETERSPGLFYEHKAKVSWKSWGIGLALQLANKLMNFKESTLFDDRIEGKTPEFGNDYEPPKNMRKEFTVTSWKNKGRNIFRIEPKTNKTDKVILFLHGGGYIFNISKFHWHMASRFVRDNSCTVLMLDYPLAPENSYVEAYNYVEDFYKDLVSTVNPRNIILFGDSAGGSLALAFAQKIKQAGVLPQPAQIILFSPWLDMALDDPETAELEQSDRILSVNKLKMAGLAFARGGNLTHYLLSPINGPVQGLGRINLFISTHELFYAQAKKFKAKCEEQGVAIDFYVYPNMLHAWLAIDSPEAEEAHKQIKTIIDR